MVLDSGSSAPANGWEILKDLIKNSRLNDSVKEQIKEQSGRIYTNLDPQRGDLKELNESLAQLTNLFRTHTHSAHTKLSNSEKLMLQYAFTDITDDVRTALAERADVQESYQEQSTAGWLASKVMSCIFGSDETGVTAREILDGINDFQEAMKNPELEISLTQVKELLGLVLEHERDLSGVENVQEMDLRQLVDLLEQKHQRKLQEAAQRLESKEEIAETSYTRMAFETLGQALDSLSQVDVHAQIEKVRQRIVKGKDQQIREGVSEFKPEVIFEGKSFKKITSDLLNAQIQSSRIKGTPLESPAKKGAGFIKKNLANNIGRISDERNLARVGIKMNEGIGNVFEALNGLETNATSAQLLSKLGYEGTVEQYTKEVEDRGAGNIAKLISKNPSGNKKEYKNIALKLWNRIIAGLKNIKRRIIRSFYKSSVQDKKNITFIQSMMPSAKNLADLKEIAERLGLEDEITKMEKHSDIIMFYLLDALIKEMADIATKSEGREDPNVSGFTSIEGANAALRDSVNTLGGKMSSFAPKESSSLMQKGLFQLVGLFGPSLAQAQGSGDSVFDVVTPAMKELGPAWKDWLTR